MAHIHMEKATELLSMMDNPEYPLHHLLAGSGAPSLTG